VQPSGSEFTVIGPDERFVLFGGYPLRPVNDGEEKISRKVAYAHYSRCGHNVFFKYHHGFRAPSRCPLGDGSIIETESEELPQ
jgi:hypothetical protein